MPSKVIRTDDIDSLLEEIVHEGYDVNKRTEFTDFWDLFSLKAKLNSEKGNIKFLGAHSSDCKDIVVLRSKNKSLLDKLPLG
jgi:hypothetical protein